MGWGVAAGVGAALASAGGSIASALQSEKAVKRQIEWEKERAKNAHQWEVQDLKAAGLNPILSAGGSGATTGGISAPVPDTSGYSGAGTALIEAINTAYNAANTNATIGKTGAETQNITQDTQNKITAQELMQKQIINESLRSGLISAQKANIEFKNLTEKYQGERAALSYWNDFLNKASGTAKNMGGLVKDAVEAFVPAKHVKEVKRIFHKNKGWTEYTTMK